jgi:hypothetical protein
MLYIALFMIAAVVLISFSVNAYQNFRYNVESGLFVADDNSDRPLSQRFKIYGKPIAEFDKNTSADDHKRKIGYWEALRKFPTLHSCLLPEGRGSSDASQFNWRSIRTFYQAELCLFHVGEYLETPEKTIEWLDSQGFDAQFVANPVALDQVAGYLRPGQTRRSAFPFFSEFTFAERGIASWLNGFQTTPPILQMFYRPDTGRFQGGRILYVYK